MAPGGYGVPQHGAGVEERRSPHGVRVVGAGDERCPSAIERQALLEALELVRRQSRRGHAARGREVGEHLAGEVGAVARLRPVARVPDAARRRQRGAELVAQHPLRRDAAVGVRAANALRHVDVRHGAAVGQAVARQSAAQAWDGAHHAEPAAFEQHVALGGAAARARRDVDDAGHRIRPVERRARAAHHLDPLGVDGRQVGEKGGGVVLRTRRVAEAQAVDQHGRVVAPHAARLNGGEAARSPQRLHANARQRADRLGHRQLVAQGELVRVDDVERLGRLPGQQRRARGGDHHLGGHAGDGQRQIAAAAAPRRAPRRRRTAPPPTPAPRARSRRAGCRRSGSARRASCRSRAHGRSRGRTGGSAPAARPGPADRRCAPRGLSAAAGCGSMTVSAARAAAMRIELYSVHAEPACCVVRMPLLAGGPIERDSRAGDDPVAGTECAPLMVPRPRPGARRVGTGAGRPAGRAPSPPLGGPGQLIRRRQVFGLAGGQLSLSLLAVASQLPSGASAMTAVVPVYRCGAAPDSHRVPSCRSSHLEHRRRCERSRWVAGGQGARGTGLLD